MTAAGPGVAVGVIALHLAAAHEGATHQAQGGVTGVPGQVFLAVAALVAQQVEVQVLQEGSCVRVSQGVCSGEVDVREHASRR